MRSGAARAKKRGYGVDRHGAGADRADLDPERRDLVGALLDGRYFGRQQLDHLGDQKALHRNRARGKRTPQSMERHAFGGRVLVEHVESVRARADQEHRPHLPQKLERRIEPRALEKIGLARRAGGPVVRRLRRRGVGRGSELPGVLPAFGRTAESRQPCDGRERPVLDLGNGECMAAGN